MNYSEQLEDKGFRKRGWLPSPTASSSRLLPTLWARLDWDWPLHQVSRHELSQKAHYDPVLVVFCYTTEQQTRVRRIYSKSFEKLEKCYLGKLFFHSVSKLKRVALKASACCSTVSRTIFQKHSETAKLKFLVVTWVDGTRPSLLVMARLIVNYCF